MGVDHFVRNLLDTRSELSTVIITLIEQEVRIACQEVRIETHKHHMYSAKACVEANEKQLKQLQAQLKGE